MKTGGGTSDSPCVFYSLLITPGLWKCMRDHPTAQEVSKSDLSDKNKTKNYAAWFLLIFRASGRRYRGISLGVWFSALSKASLEAVKQLCWVISYRMQAQDERRQENSPNVAPFFSGKTHKFLFQKVRMVLIIKLSALRMSFKAPQHNSPRRSKKEHTKKKEKRKIILTSGSLCKKKWTSVLLTDPLYPVMKRFYSDGRGFFQRDSAPIHKARGFTEWLYEDEIDVNHVLRPSCPPDLNVGDVFYGNSVLYYHQNTNRGNISFQHSSRNFYNRY